MTLLSMLLFPRYNFDSSPYINQLLNLSQVENVMETRFPYLEHIYPGKSKKLNCTQRLT